MQDHIGAVLPLCRGCGRRLWTPNDEQRTTRLCHNCTPRANGVQRVVKAIHGILADLERMRAA